jgi:outer membrane protein TolC
MSNLNYIKQRLMCLAFKKRELARSIHHTRSCSFTLEEAINFALDNNYQAINAKRDIVSSLKQKWETTATGLPQITGTADYNYQIKQPVTPLPGEIIDPSLAGTFVSVTFS